MYRLDGDEFAFWMEGGTRESIQEIYDNIQLFVANQFTVDDQTLLISVSAGACVIPGDGRTYQKLFRHAENAVEIAKMNGKNQLVFFSREMYNRKRKIMELQESLHTCVNNGCSEFELFYQPQIDAENKRVVGAEALLRCLPEGISLPHYYAGSIAPDCGRTEWNEDGTPRYLPGRVVTHWLKKDEALDRCLIDFEGFYNAMMPQAADDGARAFYWGYYIHIITDAMWQERVLRPRRESLAEPSKENIAAMRADLKLADLADYRENPHYPPLEILRNTPSFPNRYLDYYTEDDIENQVHGIPQRLAEEAATAEESLWLSPEERDEFIMFATAKCMQMVRAHLA